MSNAAWCDLNSQGDLLKLHDLCHNPKCKCQKIVNFTPEHFQLEGTGFRNYFIEPGLKIASQSISAFVAAKTKILNRLKLHQVF